MKTRNKRINLFSQRTLQLLCFVLWVTGNAGFAAGLEDKQQFEIPAQPLADALKTFSQRSGLQLFYDANLVAGKTSKTL
jgi:hypothetical protein